MQKIIVSDTSCLILLDKIGLLYLLKSLFGTVTITKEISKEFQKDLPEFFELQTPIDKTISVSLKTHWMPERQVRLL